MKLQVGVATDQEEQRQAQNRNQDPKANEDVKSFPRNDHCESR